ncbi:hypothetical protein, partial [Gordonia sihwensis]|uniref:hypothetical protein n=1 Tax=Gordonia sihwensis TaxID=173559 RepID=UPI0005EFA89A
GDPAGRRLRSRASARSPLVRRLGSLGVHLNHATGLATVGAAAERRGTWGEVAGQTVAAAVVSAARLSGSS